MATLISKSLEDTLALGEEWGRLAQPGWLIGLNGDLGAGKTQLVRGLARGLGSLARVHSPTFALLNEYTGGRCPLFHLDLYRLENRNQIVAAGLDEYLFRPDAVAVVEWIARWHGDPPNDQGPGSKGQGKLRWVTMTAVDEFTRRIDYEDFGA